MFHSWSMLDINAMAMFHSWSMLDIKSMAMFHSWSMLDINAMAKKIDALLYSKLLGRQELWYGLRQNVLNHLVRSFPGLEHSKLALPCVNQDRLHQPTDIQRLEGPEIESARPSSHTLILYHCCIMKNANKKIFKNKFISKIHS